MLHHARMLLGRAGAPAPVLDTQTVHGGSAGSPTTQTRKRGFFIGFIGSITDGTSNLYGGAAIRELASEETEDGFDVVLIVTGVVANSGWTTMKVVGSPLLRSAAVFSTSSGNSEWRWVLAGQLIGGSATTTVVEFS